MTSLSADLIENGRHLYLNMTTWHVSLFTSGVKVAALLLP
jgi:hypothetical protein